jgi:hypothetical protein
MTLNLVPEDLQEIEFGPRKVNKGNWVLVKKLKSVTKILEEPKYYFPIFLGH